MNAVAEHYLEERLASLKSEQRRGPWSKGTGESIQWRIEAVETLIDEAAAAGRKKDITMQQPPLNQTQEILFEPHDLVEEEPQRERTRPIAIPITQTSSMYALRSRAK